MKIKCALILLLFSFTPLLSEEKLIPEHKDWLEFVSPIITKKEREIFLELKTKKERDRFIPIFWKQRDPLPDTAENEFYQEYMKRVQFADAQFGRETSKKGHQTERGYYYLLLGPPIERQLYTTQSKLLPQELWYYRGEPKYGLPPYFYLIFYQPQGLGEYRLYYPGVEGPEKLVIASLDGRSTNRAIAFRTIREISGELANASLSYLPGERALGMTSFSSDSIIASARSLPEKKFSDNYARTYLHYKDYVETDYTHNFIESNFKVKVFKNFNQFFIHWAVEPKKVNFASYEGNYYASFQLVLRIEDTKGNPVLEKEEEIPLNITPEQYRRHERSIFSFQDLMPVISGNYKIFFLLKNKTAKDFTSFETEISVPQDKSGTSLSNLVLYHNQEKLGESQKKTIKAFSFGDYQYLTSAHDNFLPQKEIGFYCQVYNLKTAADKNVLLEVFPVNSDEAVRSFKKPLQEVLAPDGEGINTGPLSFLTLKSGYYEVMFSILDSSGKKLFTQKENFILLSQPYPVIPWIYSKQQHAFPGPEHLFLLGSQFFMTGQYEHARDYLEQAQKINDAPHTRLLLAKTLYALHRFRDSLTVAFPVYEATQDNEAAKIIAVNYVGLEDWPAALVYLEKLMGQAVEISVLNLAAQCYLKLDLPEKALPLLQKSLKLNPDQERIKELEKKIKKFEPAKSRS